MRLSKKGEYACLALIHCAENYAQGVVNSKQIATRYKIPLKYLEQILLSLKRAGFVRAHAGAHGGYELSRDPARITLAQVIRHIDGPLAPVAAVSRYFYEPTPAAKNKALLQVFKDVRDYTSHKMESTTLKDLCP